MDLHKSNHRSLFACKKGIASEHVIPFLNLPKYMY
jgi:hypothetical protein